MVNDSTRLASSETITDTDSGENRYFAVPCSRKTGTNTMQMHSVERNVGVPTSPQPCTMASARCARRPRLRSMFSITTVPLSTRMPTASAKPPSVMVLSVSPPIPISSTAVMIDKGMAARIITVNRQLPRNSRIMSAVSAAAMAPPISTLLSAAFTNID
jgi:hypothetical protein